MNVAQVEQPVVPNVSAPERLHALRQTDLLDSPSNPVFDRLTSLATTLFDVPVALVTMVDENRQFFASCLGLPAPFDQERQTPLSDSFCQYALTSNGPLLVEDAPNDPRFSNHPAITSLGVTAYAGIPLITSQGHVLGSFCVIDHRPRQWNAEAIETLQTLAASVMTEIELRLAVKEARRRADEAQRLHAEKTAILERITDAFAAVDTQWNYTYLNSRAQIMLQREESLVGKNMWAEFPDLVGTHVYTHMHRALQENIPLSYENFYAPLSTWFEVHLYPSGEGLSLYFKDITERKRAEADIIALNQRLQRSVVETYHRVKNNLQNIAATLDMHLDNENGPVSVDDLQWVNTRIRSVASLHDMLTHQSKEDPTGQGVSVRSLLRRLQPLLSQLFGANTLQMDVAEAYIPDKQAMSLTLLVNELISNAIKHGRGQVELCFTVQDTMGCLTVSDNGPGFAPNFSASQAANTGLELIETLTKIDMNGNVHYANGPHGGASVTVSFPLLMTNAVVQKADLTSSLPIAPDSDTLDREVALVDTE